MRTRRLISVFAMGLLGAASAFATSYGEGTMWNDLAKAQQETAFPQAAAFVGAARGGPTEGGMYDQLAAQQEDFRAQLARGMAGRSAAEAELSSGYRSGDLPLFPEESISDRLRRQHHQ